MKKNFQRIIIPITGQGAMVHIVRSGLLENIAQFVQPVILLYWNDKNLQNELTQNGYEVHQMKFIPLSAKYNDIYYKLNLWYLNKVLKFNGIKIEDKLNQHYQNIQKKFIKKLRNYYNLFLINFPFVVKNFLKTEEQIFQQEKIYTEYNQWMKELNIYGLFTVTPFLKEINFLARVLKNNQKKILASVHSFDNVTKRGWQPCMFDKYIVWNKYNKNELLYIFKSLKAEDVFIAGAPQFDFHYNPQYIIPKNDWLKMLNMPADKKIILYAGGTITLFPTEPQYPKHLKDAIEQGLISKDVVILIRNHPLDTVERWKKFIGESANIFYYEPQHGKEKLDYSNVTDNDLKMLVSTLHYCDVHINLCSTMTIDGSVFNKPQIAPYYDDVNKKGEPALRAVYYQEHYKPILKSNVIQLVSTKEELISTVNEALQTPEKFTQNCQTCISEIITYTDGNSTNRVTTIFKNFFLS